MKSHTAFVQVLGHQVAKVGLAFFVCGLALPTFAQSVEIAPVIDHNEPMVISGETFTVLDSLAITVKRDQLDGPATQYTKVSADGRYELIEILPTLTKERKEAEAPAPRQLYRFAIVLDKEAGKTIKAALPIRFEP